MSTQNPQNIAIIGAGIMGLMSAHTLAQRGHSVTIFDPAGFPHKNSASYVAGGMLAPYAEIEHITPEFIEMGLKSIKIWQTLFPALTHQNGSLFIAHDEDRYILERFQNHLPQEAFEQTNAQQHEPALPEKFAGALLLPEEGHINPEEAIPALYEQLKDKITFIKEAQSPENLTDKFDHIIDCRGPAAIEDDPELRGIKGELAIVHNPEFQLSRPVRLMHPRYPLYIVPRADNVFMIGATQIEGAGEDHTSVRSGLELLSALYSLHPSFGDAQIIALKAGIRPAYKDNLPRITQRENITTANGLFRHGFLLSPALAEDIATRIEQHAESKAA